MMISVARSLNC